MKVWVIESGDYEQRVVDGVATSPEAGLEFLRRTHPNGNFTPLRSTSHGDSVQFSTTFNEHGMTQFDYYMIPYDLAGDGEQPTVERTIPDAKP